MHRALIPILLLIFPRRHEQLPDVLCRLPHELTKNFRPVNDLQRFGLKRFGELPCNEGFSSTRGSIEKDSFDVLDAKFVDYGQWHPS